MRFHIEDNDNENMDDIGTPPPFRRDTYEEYLKNQPVPRPIQPIQLDTNTYISAGRLLALLVGFFWLINSIYNAKDEITKKQVETRTELAGRLDKADSRIDILTDKMKDVQTNRGMLNYQDFFKWCVHLQKDNPQIKVPEPETSK